MKKKKIIAVAFSCFLTVTIFSQVTFPITKIHAYKQATIPGIPETFFDENGNKINKERKPTFSYWFYVEIPKTTEIEIVDLWISGIRFKAKTEIINSLPVKKTIVTATSDSEVIILVPPSSSKVLLTYPTGLLKNSKISSKYLSKLIAQSELVIGFYWKEKKYFASAKQITLLEPDAHL